jgi:hypothetical protein
MNTRTLLAAAVAAQLSIMSLGAGAQEANESPKGNTVFYMAGGAAPIMPFGGKIEVLRAGAGSVMGEAVRDKPYSAESITESAQMLADGNRITTTNRARVYRDSAGRTRREQELDAVGVWRPNEPLSMITINDPVTNLSYFLDPHTETVRELAPFRLETNKRVQELEVRRADGATVATKLSERPSSDGGNVVVHEYAGGDEVANVTIATDGAPPFEIAFPPTRVAALRTPVFGAVAAFNGGPAGEPVTESLGEQVLEGVLAQGTRVTQTIPADAIGNERPIQIVHEEWYSPDIEAVVLRRDLDPRFGETTYRLINVDRSEPAPELFTIPLDYAVQRDSGPRAVTQALPAGAPGVAGERVERRVFLVQPDPAAEAQKND